MPREGRLINLTENQYLFQGGLLTAVEEKKKELMESYLISDKQKSRDEKRILSLCLMLIYWSDRETKNSNMKKC